MWLQPGRRESDKGMPAIHKPLAAQAYPGGFREDSAREAHASNTGPGKPSWAADESHQLMKTGSVPTQLHRGAACCTALWQGAVPCLLVRLQLAPSTWLTVQQNPNPKPRTLMHTPGGVGG